MRYREIEATLRKLDRVAQVYWEDSILWNRVRSMPLSKQSWFSLNLKYSETFLFNVKARRNQITVGELLKGYQ